MGQALEPGTVANAMLKELKADELRSLTVLKAKTGHTAKQISNAASQLRQRGLLHIEKPGQYKLTVAGLAAAESGVAFKPGPKGPSNARRAPKNTLRQKAWRSMRMRRQFTIPDIVCDAESGEKRAEDNLGRWFRWLKACGYIHEQAYRKRSGRQGSNGHKRYRLIKDTGPFRPGDI